MIDEATTVRVRHLFYAEHWKVGTIATQLCLHRDTVNHAIGADRFVTHYSRVRGSMLDTYKPLIIETLQKYPTLRATRVLDMIRPRGYAGSIDLVRAFCREVRPQHHEAYFRLETMPGEQAQVDWGSFGHIMIGHAKRALSCFVLVLSYSRAVYARFFLDQTMESFLRGHVEAFESFGGVPRVVLYDNLKSVVLERDGDHTRFHPRILEFAGHYHFMPRPCAVRRATDKGKVERHIQYIRHSFFAARRFASLADLNAQLADWIDRVADDRRHPASPDPQRTVRDALADERPRLLALPDHRAPIDRVVVVTSGKRPYVRFDLNDYSIPSRLVRKPLTLVADEACVRVLDGDQEVARHARCYDRGRFIEDPAHLADLASQKRHAHSLRGRDRLRAVCKHADAFIAALAARDVSMARHTTRLIKLLDQHGASDLDAALATSLERGAISADSVAHLIDQRLRSRRVVPPIPLVLPDDPRVRDLRLVPHSLASYDQINARPLEASDEQ